MKNMKSPTLKSKLITVIGIVFLLSCGRETSQMTGWNYNDPKNGGFEVVPYLEQ